ncbi:hypothetical protein FHP25_13300 [Vineibacter terrae]|uniref:Uncharacterized protein n=1 Tax=Vineibacter terrae TaxID=2586908 RepID=A0A5C8PNJ7_9HYPH|nr:hypothetical protein [Vineibacter terrae]TXL75625.1 hypothetical protein FHP25_13300 [Vineibacter terrae]
MSYNTKVYHKQDGDEVVVADGGKITVEAGGSLIVGGADLGALPTSDPGDGVTLWNDAGVLKIASGP